MTKEVLPDLYQIEVPLPGNPLKAVNCYLIAASGRFLIIDTGMNRPECELVMSTALRELDVDLNKTDFFITHWHADHLGLVSTLATPSSKVYFNKPESIVGHPQRSWEENAILGRQHGFQEDELSKALSTHPGRRYGGKRQVDFYILGDGDEVRIGDYSFTCIETPGHSPGHICLYERDKKVLVSGDHILIDITPNIAQWSEGGNPLKDYLASLDKVYDLDVELVLPGHRQLFTDHRKRIQELKHHHETRANEVLSILEKGEQTAYEVASQMSWDIDYKSWKQFPASQKWFATGEAIAHLAYLEQKGMVSRKGQEKVLFSLKGSRAKR